MEKKNTSPIESFDNVIKATKEVIIAKIEDIEKLHDPALFTNGADLLDYHHALLNFKQTAIRVFNLPTADPDEGSPGQEDIKG